MPAVETRSSAGAHIWETRRARGCGAWRHRTRRHDASRPSESHYGCHGAAASETLRRVLKSGVTVLTADCPFIAGVDVMGGAPGTRETDLLAPGRLVRKWMHWSSRAARPSGSTRHPGWPKRSGSSRRASARATWWSRSYQRRSSSTSGTAEGRTGSRIPTAHLGPKLWQQPRRRSIWVPPGRGSAR
jgi:hypothetical protein